MKYITPYNGIPYHVESPQAKIRNILGPHWTLVSIVETLLLNNEISLTDKSKKLLTDVVLKCKDNQPIILDLLDMTYTLPWKPFEYKEGGSYPKQYGKYFVRRKDGKIHWETWNGSGWAYNGNVITHFLEISAPLGYEVDGNATG